MFYKKLNIAQNFIDKNFKEWVKTYGEDLLGVHLGNKTRGDILIKRYAIVFHFKKKLIKPINPVPSFFEVDCGNKIGIKRIPTDVIEAGDITLQYTLGSKVFKQNYNGYAGGLGFYLSRNSHVYLCSNMHVLAPELINSSDSYYRDLLEQQIKDVRINNKLEAYLEEAYFDYMDVGIARMERYNKSELNIIQGYGRIRGYLNIGVANFYKARQRKYLMIGSVSNKQETYLLNINVNIRHKQGRNILFSRHLLAFNRCTNRGDSGSPIVDKKTLKIVGIVWGVDEKRNITLVIPIQLILNRFNAKLIF